MNVVKSVAALCSVLLLQMLVPFQDPPSAEAQAACVPPPAGLISWWPGNGNANDIKDGNNGTLQNGASFASGEVGQGFTFDGNYGYLSVPDSANLRITGPLTIDAWVYIRSYSEWGRFAGKDWGPGYPYHSYVFGMSRWGKGYFGLFNNGYQTQIENTTSTLPLNQWTHVAGVWDGAVMRYYVNGVQDPTTAYFSGPIDVSTAPLKIGGEPGYWGSNSQWGLPGNVFESNAVIDEVDIFNRALSPAEIQSIYTAGSAGKCTGAATPTPTSVPPTPTPVPPTSTPTLVPPTPTPTPVPPTSTPTPTLTPDTVPPVVGAVSPTTVTQSQAATLSATYSDNVGVTSCTLLVDGVDQGTMTLSNPGGASGTASKAYTFDTVGVNTAQVKCTDAANNQGSGPQTSIGVVEAGSSATVTGSDTKTAAPGGATTASTFDSGGSGVTATLTNNGSTPASVTVATYSGNPVSLPPIFNVDHYTDVRAYWPGDTSRLVVDFYYPKGEPDYDTETRSEPVYDRVDNWYSVPVYGYSYGCWDSWSRDPWGGWWQLPTCGMRWGFLYWDVGHSWYYSFVGFQEKQYSVPKKLTYLAPGAWLNVLSSGGVEPLFDPTDDTNGTTSGGRFRVVFDKTSRPTITQLVGTVFADGKDKTPPAISQVPGNITAEATNGGGAAVTYAAPPATDGLDGPVPVSCTPASGSVFPLGPSTVTCSATDSSGNTASASFTVTVRDTTAPVLTPLLGDFVAPVGPSGGVVNYPPVVTASDAVGVTSGPTCSPASGATFPLGRTTVTCTAADAAGNSSGASFTATTFTAYTLTYTAGANGTISGTSPQTLDPGGSGTQVTAVPNTGYRFVTWSDGVATAARTDTNVPANVSVTASFAINTYTLTYTAGANGTISGTSAQTVNHGASGTQVTAVPNTGYHFLSWSDGVTTAARTDTNVTADISVAASFAAPVVNAGAPGTINEGSTFTSSGSFTDPGADTWTATVDYGDGSGIQPLTLSGQTFNLSHAYADNGMYAVTVTVTDKEGGVGSAQVTVTVNNVSPTATFTAPASAVYGSSIALSFANPSDPSPVDSAAGFAYSFDCGDGAGYGTSSANKTALCPTGKVGARTVKGRVFDKDGGFTEYVASVAVTPAPLTIAANSQTKTYGQTVSFAGTEFTTSGLLRGDTVSNVTLTSGGAAATATVVGSPYDIVPSNAQGTGLGNYQISYGNGKLTVSKANARITVTPYSVIYDEAAHTATGTAMGVKGEALAGLDLSKTTHTSAGTYRADPWVFTDVTGNYNSTGGSVDDFILYRFGGWLQPIPAPVQTFKVGSGIPVKFQLFEANGKAVSTAVITLTTNGQAATPQGGSNSGDLFRYDPTSQQYIYNLSTKGLATGNLTLKVSLDDGATDSVVVMLK